MTTTITERQPSAPTPQLRTRSRGALKVVLVNVLLLGALYAISEAVSSAYLMKHFAPYRYSLAVQGGGSMRENPYQVWEDPPNYTTWTKLAHYNNLGFRRNQDMQPGKAPGVRRIFVMGGSTAYGSQPVGMFQQLSGQKEYGTDETIAGWMERILNARHSTIRFEVINAATNWTKLHQQMIRYLRQIKDLSPDAIVSIDGENDSSLRPYPRFLNGWDVTIDSYRTEVLGTAQYRLRPILQHSHTAYLYAMLLFRHKEMELDSALVSRLGAVGLPDDYERRLKNHYDSHQMALEQRIQEYIRTMQYFHDILAVDGIPHIFVLQPLAYLDDTKRLTPREKAVRGHIFSNADDAFYWHINFYRRVYNEGMSLVKAGVPFQPALDPFREMAGDAYTDYCHFTPAANKVFAERLIRELELRHPDLFKEM